MQDTSESHAEIIHDDPVGAEGDEWFEHRWTLLLDDDRIWLCDEESNFGDWGEGEIPNCPWCGANILVAYLHDTLSPWEFFTGRKPYYES